MSSTNYKIFQSSCYCRDEQNDVVFAVHVDVVAVVEVQVECVFVFDPDVDVVVVAVPDKDLIN